MNQVITYTSTRLHFKANVIESLEMNDLFEIVTDVATWRMTRADFYRFFPNVVASESYSGPRREYHYRTAPSKADEFRIR